MRKTWAILLLLASGMVFAQTSNQNFIPAQTGLDLGKTNQRWDAYVRNFDINGTCSVNGVVTSCIGSTNATSIQGKPVTPTPPLLNQCLVFNGSTWVPQTCPGGGGGGGGINISINGGSASAQTQLNFNNYTFAGLTFTYSNPGGININTTVGGTLNNTGITSPFINITPNAPLTGVGPITLGTVSSISCPTCAATGTDLTTPVAGTTVTSTHIAGSTSGFLPKFNGTGNILNSGVFDSGSAVTVSAAETADLSSAAHTLPLKKGLIAAKPGTCTVGEKYFATDATAGQNDFNCTSTNVWTQEIGGGGGGGAISGLSGATKGQPTYGNTSGALFSEQMALDACAYHSTGPAHCNDGTGSDMAQDIAAAYADAAPLMAVNATAYSGNQNWSINPFPAGQATPLYLGPDVVVKAQVTIVVPSATPIWGTDIPSSTSPGSVIQANGANPILCWGSSGTSGGGGCGTGQQFNSMINFVRVDGNSQSGVVCVQNFTAQENSGIRMSQITDCGSHTSAGIALDIEGSHTQHFSVDYMQIYNRTQTSCHANDLLIKVLSAPDVDLNHMTITTQGCSGADFSFLPLTLMTIDDNKNLQLGVGGYFHMEGPDALPVSGSPVAQTAMRIGDTTGNKNVTIGEISFGNFANDAAGTTAIEIANNSNVNIDIEHMLRFAFSTGGGTDPNPNLIVDNQHGNTLTFATQTSGIGFYRFAEATSVPETNATPEAGLVSAWIHPKTAGSAGNPIVAGGSGLSSYFAGALVLAPNSGTTTPDVTVVQQTNGDTVIYGKQNTSVSPTGSFIQFQNNAATADLFRIFAASGATTQAGNEIIATSGTSGFSILQTSSSASPAGSGTQVNSPHQQLQGNFWNGSASTSDLWDWQDVMPNGSSNPTATLTLSHSGTSGAIAESVPGTFNVVADGVHSGSVQLTGNTTLPTLGTNTWSLIGPNSASFTAFGWQGPTAENASAGLAHVGAASSHVSQLTVSLLAVPTDISATGTPSSSTFLRGDGVWAGAGSSPSLDLVSGSAASATANEVAAGDNYIYNGVETGNLTFPVLFQNTNSSNNNTSGGLAINAKGTSTGAIPLLIAAASGTGDLFRAYTGGTFSSVGAYTVGTKQFSIGNTGIPTVAAFSSTGLVHNSSGGVFSSSLIVAADVTTNTLTHTQVDATVFSTDSKADVVDLPFHCADAGGSDTYACNLSPAVTSYVTGTHYCFKANTNNTGAATINFNTVGAIPIKKLVGNISTTLDDNDILSGQWACGVYDGTNLQITSNTAAVTGTGVRVLATAPTLTNPVVGTQTAADNSTKAASTAYVDTKAVTLPAAGTSVSLAGPAEIFICSSTCTVTPPVPVAGYQFCVFNADNVATVITMAAIGSSARYENTARTAYGTAGTGTFVSGGAVKDSVCIVGIDSTHYITTNSTGTWVAN